MLHAMSKIMFLPASAEKLLNLFVVLKSCKDLDIMSNSLKCFHREMPLKC